MNPEDGDADEEYTINGDVDLEDYELVTEDGRKVKWRRISRYIGKDMLYSTFWKTGRSSNTPRRIGSSSS